MIWVDISWQLKDMIVEPRMIYRFEFGASVWTFAELEINASAHF